MTLTEALAALKAAGKIENAWLPGMMAVTGDGQRKFRFADYSYGSWTKGGGTYSEVLRGSPDLTDPATVGCLLALLREAQENSGVWVGPSHPEAWAVFIGGADGWEEFAFGETDGEAIAAALIALAEQP